MPYLFFSRTSVTAGLTVALLFVLGVLSGYMGSQLREVFANTVTVTSTATVAVKPSWEAYCVEYATLSMLAEQVHGGDLELYYLGTSTLFTQVVNMLEDYVRSADNASYQYKVGLVSIRNYIDAVLRADYTEAVRNYFTLSSQLRYLEILCVNRV